MVIGSRLWNRIANTLGFVCLALTLLLLSPGVRAVRADDGGETLGRVASMGDGSEASCQASPNPTLATPAAAAKRGPAVPPPALADPEAETDVINLNTRGYNYATSPVAADAAPRHVDPAKP